MGIPMHSQEYKWRYDRENGIWRQYRITETYTQKAVVPSPYCKGKWCVFVNGSIVVDGLKLSEARKY